MPMSYGVMFCKSVVIYAAERGDDRWVVLGFRVLRASGVILVMGEIVRRFVSV